MKKPTLSLLVFFAFFTAISPRNNLLAAPGDLDLTFSGGRIGLRLPCSSDNPQGHVSLALTPDNQIIFLGKANCSSNNIIFASIHADGSTDIIDLNSMIANVLRRYGSDSGFVRMAHVFVQADGKIVIGGDLRVGPEPSPSSTPDVFYSGVKPFLIRLTADGSQDRGFGDSGLVLPSDTLGFVYSVSVRPDGPITVCGTTPDKHRSIIRRFNEDGSQDTTFGGDGQVEASCPYLSDIATQSWGRILAHSSLSTGEVGLIRLLADGTRDTSFHTVPIPSNEESGIVVQKDDKIIVSDFGAITRLNADGTLDTSFGNGGSVSGDDIAALLPYGIVYMALTKWDKIVVATGSIDDRTHMRLARFTRDGHLDTTFNGVGYVTIDAASLPAAAMYPSELVVENDDKIVLGGVSVGLPTGSAQQFDATLLRYEGDPLIRLSPAQQRSLSAPIRSFPYKFTPLFLMPKRR